MALDPSMVRTFGASLSLTSRAPSSEVPVLLAGESVAIHVELSPAAQDVLVTVAMRGPDQRAMLWSSGVPPEHEVRIAPSRGPGWSDPLELDVGVFVPDLEGSRAPYCAVVELDVVRGDVMRRRAASGTTTPPRDEELKGMAPGDWTRIARPVLVATPETPAGSVDDAQWEQLASQSERCAAEAASSG